MIYKSETTFAMFSTTNFLSEDPYICSLIDQKSVLSSLLSMKVNFKAIVCVCDQILFNNLIITLQEEDLMDDISMEYEFYEASKQEIPLLRSLSSWMNLPLLVYAYLFPSQEGKSMQTYILALRHLPTWVLVCDCPFLEEQSLYKLELNLDAM